MPLAYHTRAMDPALDELRECAARDTCVCQPMIPMISNVLGRVVHPAEADVFTPSYFADYCRVCCQPAPGRQHGWNLQGRGLGHCPGRPVHRREEAVVAPFHVLCTTYEEMGAKGSTVADVYEMLRVESWLRSRA